MSYSDLERMMAHGGRAWLLFCGLEAYVRVSHFPYKGNIARRVVHLSTLSAGETGKGALKAFLPRMEALAVEADIPLLMVENVLTERLANFLEREGWVRSKEHPFDVVYFKQLREMTDEDWLKR